MVDEHFSFDGYRTTHFEEKSILWERRVILGLTQKTVAERAGIPLQSYQNFESGKRKLSRASFDIACRVLDALEMDIVAFHQGNYAFGEEVYSSSEGLRYKKTGKLTSEDVTDDSEE
jgi:transcriptional regulator with XRE-family HTH domain